MERGNIELKELCKGRSLPGEIRIPSMPGCSFYFLSSGLVLVQREKRPVPFTPIEIQVLIVKQIPSELLKKLFDSQEPEKRHTIKLQGNASELSVNALDNVSRGMTIYQIGSFVLPFFF
jgi:hypothetical protein